MNLVHNNKQWTILDVALAGATILLVVYFYLKYAYLDYRKRKGVPYMEPEFFYGNARRLVKGEIFFTEQFLEFYQKLRSRGVRHGGAYVLFSPLYIRTDRSGDNKVHLAKRFRPFYESWRSANPEADTLSGHLFNLENAKWRDLRVKRISTFRSETLRINPPVSGLPRVCNKPYRVPGTDVTIDPGTTVSIPVYGIHMDAECYQNPEVFDPERFSEKNNSKRPSCTFMPFGEGPRICIDDNWHHQEINKIFINW
ncbi:hypothetical protein NQ318_012596 [Aromia moschata]|uniref:Cytochrome P450 n=1 Tax=Aromia moschata TaxID=1265417 RepID=A0AAV8YLD8_9CUCU|nr:hypothetical protein NQ318_012596 [Aromia moschata]